jgi:hypothetical protein
MCGENSIGEAYGCELELPKAIAKGDDCCQIGYKMKVTA